MFSHPDLKRWLPSERLVAGNDSGGFVFDQRVVTKALRDIGPFSFLADGEPFAGCLFHEMVIADGRKMSKHLGNVVDPDELVAEHGADTVRLAVLYAAGPAKALNWNEGALRFASRFLNGLWDYTHERIASRCGGAGGRRGRRRHRLHPRAARQMVRQRGGADHRGPRAAADAQGGAQRDPPARADPGLREAGLKRRGALSRPDFEALLEALALLARVLAPFAPHVAERLLLALGEEDGEGMTGPWPGSPAAAETAGDGAGLTGRRAARGIIDRYSGICYTPRLMIRRQHGKRRRRFAKAGGLPSRARGGEGR